MSKQYMCFMSLFTSPSSFPPNTQAVESNSVTVGERIVRWGMAP